MDKKEVLNIKVLEGYAATPADIKFFGDIFIRQTQSDIEALAAECSGGQNRSWVEICHKIKGAAGMAGASRLEDLCCQGEAMDVAAQGERAALCAQIAAAFDEVRSAFARLGGGS